MNEWSKQASKQLRTFRHHGKPLFIFHSLFELQLAVICEYKMLQNAWLIWESQDRILNHGSTSTYELQLAPYHSFIWNSEFKISAQGHLIQSCGTRPVISNSTATGNTSCFFLLFSRKDARAANALGMPSGDMLPETREDSHRLSFVSSSGKLLKFWPGFSQQTAVSFKWSLLWRLLLPQSRILMATVKIVCY